MTHDRTVRSALLLRHRDRVGFPNDAFEFQAAMMTSSGAYEPRVALRRVTPLDHAMLFSLRRDLQLQSLLLTVPDQLDDPSLLNWVERRENEPAGMFQIVENQATGEAIGYAQIVQVHRRNRTGYGGLVLTAPARGAGLGSATLKAIVGLGRTELGLVKLLAEIRTDNIASIALHLSAGYRVAGTLEKHFLDAGGQRFDVLLLERRLSDA